MGPQPLFLALFWTKDKISPNGFGSRSTQCVFVCFQAFVCQTVLPASQSNIILCIKKNKLKVKIWISSYIYGISFSRVLVLTCLSEDAGEKQKNSECLRHSHHHNLQRWLRRKLKKTVKTTSDAGSGEAAEKWSWNLPTYTVAHTDTNSLYSQLKSNCWFSLLNDVKRQKTIKISIQEHVVCKSLPLQQGLQRKPMTSTTAEDSHHKLSDISDKTSWWRMFSLVVKVQQYDYLLIQSSNKINLKSKTTNNKSTFVPVMERWTQAGINNCCEYKWFNFTMGLGTRERF